MVEVLAKIEPFRRSHRYAATNASTNPEANAENVRRVGLNSLVF